MQAESCRPISQLGNYCISTRTKIFATTVALVTAVATAILATITFGTVGLVGGVIGGSIIGIALAALYCSRMNNRKPNSDSPDLKPTSLTSKPLPQLPQSKKSNTPRSGTSANPLDDAQKKSVPAPALDPIVPADTLQKKAFSNVDSTQLVQIKSVFLYKNRNDFLGHPIPMPKPLIGKSPFVPQSMAVHLLKDKKDSALGVKYKHGDKITNMEGAMHTFVTPVCKNFMTQDCYWKGRVDTKKEFDGTQFRPVILSATIHPDFETPDVTMKLLQVEKDKIECSEEEQTILTNSLAKEIPDPVNKGAEYETNLKKLMIYHLIRTHSLQKKEEIKPDQILSLDDAQKYLEQLISTTPQENIINSLEGRFLQCPNGTLISLEAFFNVYVEQVTNEFKVLNPNTPQGYIYTINPPKIFVCQLDYQAFILNRLQALAFKALVSTRPDLFSNMRVLAFNDFADKGMISIYQAILPKVQIQNQDNIYEEGGLLDKNPGLALVLHNNSDGFGQNIQFEGPSSQDGMIGYYSNAACVLKREQEFEYIF